MGNNTLLDVRGIYKSYGSTRALIDVSMSIQEGEVHGLIGENGSGKSTLSAVIAGIHQCDSGKMFLQGKSYSVKNSIDAAQKGVCIVMQEQGTFLQTTVAENIFIGFESLFKKRGAMQNKKMQVAAAEILEYTGISHIKPHVLCSTLSFEERKLVEIARTMYFNPKLLIIDETTTALTKSGRSILYGLIAKLREEGKSVLLISHDIDEVMEQCNRITVLRDGNKIQTLEKKEFSPKTIKRLMVGRDMNDKYYRTDYEETSYRDEDVVLSVQNVTTDMLKDVSLEVHRGEILGIGGLTECGMHELGKVMFGAVKPHKGSIVSSGNRIIKDPNTATRNAISYISKDRDKESLMTAASIFDNICLPSLTRLRRKGFITNRSMKKFAVTWCKKLSVKMANVEQYVNQLSGGNKQKVVVAKWLGFNCDVFIMDCPTRGIDVGVKASIYELMEKLRTEGKAIVMISEELPELIGMCDNVVIIKDGTISGTFKRNKKLNEHMLIDYMI